MNKADATKDFENRIDRVTAALDSIVFRAYRLTHIDYVDMKNNKQISKKLDALDEKIRSYRFMIDKNKQKTAK